MQEFNKLVFIYANMPVFVDESMLEDARVSVCECLSMLVYNC